jgi:hypothetical protein
MTRSSNSNAIIPYARSAAVPMGLYALDALLRQTPGIITAGANALGRKTTNFLNGTNPPGQVTSMGAPRSSLLGYDASLSNCKIKKGRRRKQRVSRQIAQHQFRVQIPVLFGLTNTAANLLTGSIWLGSQNTNFAYDFSASNSNVFSSLAGAFRYVKWHSVVAKFLPTTGDSTTGSMAICFDASQLSNTPITSRQIIERRGVISDVKAPFIFKWTPDTEQERETKMNTDSSSVAVTAVGEGSLRAFAPGALRLRSDNSLVDTTPIGNLVLELDVTFSDVY